MTEEKQFEDYDSLQSVFGGLDGNVRVLEKCFGVRIFASNTCVKISGEDENVKRTLQAVDVLIALSKKEQLTRERLNMVVDLIANGKSVNIKEMTSTAAVTFKGKEIRPKTLGQKEYVDAIRRSPIVFGVGPAGTGKTYLAVALAVTALKAKETDRIILTRPAVEAGEKLGFLPGDLNEKVDPYLRPVNDALQEMLGSEAYAKYVERNSIEIAPLAYMRGRTLSNSFIILDEAQNTTKEQMKMFLTRMGENSKIVVNGDVTQIDLPSSVVSGIKHAIEVLEGVEGVEVVRLGVRDVVRHELVARIIAAYEKAEKADGEKVTAYGKKEADEEAKAVKTGENKDE